MITFTGERPVGLPEVYKEENGHKQLIYPHKFWALFRQITQSKPSCTGFEWGYSGAGPHCLAFCLLCISLQDDRSAIALHECFAKTYCYFFPHDGWRMTSEEIKRWAMRQPEYIPTIEDALRDPVGFVEGMIEINGG